MNFVFCILESKTFGAFGKAKLLIAILFQVDVDTRSAG
jgi:hypothetical protein